MGLENAGQMALVGKAAGDGGPRHGFAFREQAPRCTHAAIGQIGVRRHAGRAAEGAKQLETRKAGGFRQPVEIDRLAKAFFENGPRPVDAAGLAGFETGRIQIGVAQQHEPVGSDKVLVDADALFARLHPLMGRTKERENLGVAHDRRLEAWGAMSDLAGHVLGQLLHQRDGGIGHAIAEAAIEGAAVVNDAGIDDADVAGAGVNLDAVLAIGVAAGVDDAHDIGVVRMLRKTMSEKGRGKAFEPVVARITPKGGAIASIVLGGRQQIGLGQTLHGASLARRAGGVLNGIAIRQRAIRLSHSSSSIVSTPNSRALASFEPAPRPATTRSVFFEIEPETLAPSRSAEALASSRVIFSNDPVKTIVLPASG